MPLQTLQHHVAEFVRENHLETDIESRLLDLAAEVGELAKEALLSTAYGRRDFAPTAAWAAEMGDVLFALICLANTSEVDLAAALHDASAKYRARLSAQ